MRVGHYRMPAATRDAYREFPDDLGISWAQFGDELFVYAADTKWIAVEGEAERRGLELLAHPTSIPESTLYLVSQKGRLFQQLYPDVPVLFDNGRYLVVLLAPETATRIASPTEPTFFIRPLRQGEVVFDRYQPVGRAPIPWIQNLVNTVSQAGLQTDLQHLVSYHTRYSTSADYSNAATWAQNRLSAMGYTVSLNTITVAGTNSYNVVGEKLGTGTGTRDLILVVAHLDSINQSGGASAAAPGADDNGSGSAGLLEIARVLKNHVAEHDLRFILFGGEEQGLLGSKQYLSGLSATEKARIRGVINMDMIGTLNTAAPTVLLEGDVVSQSLINTLATAASDYTALTVQTSLNPWGSDHVPFINASLPAVLTIEGADSANPHDHTANDTLAHINYNLILEIVRMNIACATSLIKQGGTTMAVQFSGRYKYNGGYEYRTASGGRLTGMTIPSTIHNLSEPIYRDDVDNIVSPPQNWIWWDEDWIRNLLKLRFTLHIDIDGTDPLNVVSGTVSQLLAVSTFKNPAQFIGQVTSNAPIASGRHLVVKNFSIIWPNGDTVNQMEIDVTSPLGGPPTADVHFVTAAGQKLGPYTVTQESPYFRDVEVEMDREDHAVDPEPYDTHTHPDRPATLAKESLTLVSAFAKAGIKITKSAGTNVIASTAAGSDKKWTNKELHTAMEQHWSAYKNEPQWKVWVFLAEEYYDASVGGIMFDSSSVERQGTAVFTKCEYFHSATGAYPKANPPAAEAAKRELFFDLVHETGHAFNLFHSHHKSSDTPWSAVPWMPLVQNPKALSWMSYPDVASGGTAAKWFYDRFHFRFTDVENLFLRHAPARFVMMGSEDFGQNHGRVTRSSLDPRLQLVVRCRKNMFELGEPVTLELRLKNISDEDVTVSSLLDLSDSLIEVAVTNPKGERLPFLPFLRTRRSAESVRLEPNKALYCALPLVVGLLGSPFQEPGAYRIEACYTNLDGRTAAAVMQLYVRPPAHFDDLPVVNELFDARVGHVITVGGTRLEEINDKLDWVLGRLGDEHPARHRLLAARSGGFSQNFKVVDRETRAVRLLDADPEYVERTLRPMIERTQGAADSLGHIGYGEVVGSYTDSAVRAGKTAEARTAQSNMISLFKERQVIPAVIKKAEEHLAALR